MVCCVLCVVRALSCHFWEKDYTPIDHISVCVFACEMCVGRDDGRHHCTVGTHQSYLRTVGQ